jgi:hypothetical protein
VQRARSLGARRQRRKAHRERTCCIESRRVNGARRIHDTVSQAAVRHGRDGLREQRVHSRRRKSSQARGQGLRASGRALQRANGRGRGWERRRATGCGRRGGGMRQRWWWSQRAVEARLGCSSTMVALCEVPKLRRVGPSATASTVRVNCSSARRALARLDGGMGGASGDDATSADWLHGRRRRIAGEYDRRAQGRRQRSDIGLQPSSVSCGAEVRRDVHRTGRPWQ